MYLVCVPIRDGRRQGVRLCLGTVEAFHDIRDRARTELTAYPDNLREEISLRDNVPIRRDFDQDFRKIQPHRRESGEQFTRIARSASIPMLGLVNETDTRPSFMALINESVADDDEWDF